MPSLTSKQTFMAGDQKAIRRKIRRWNPLSLRAGA